VLQRLEFVAFSDGKPASTFPENALVVRLTDSLSSKTRMTGASPPWDLVRGAGRNAVGNDNVKRRG
jgi:hypothetical protein